MLLPPPVLAPESVVVRPPVQARPQSVVGRPSLVSVKVPHDLHDGASGFDFTYLGFQFHAALPDNVSPGTPVIVRLSADAWAQAWARVRPRAWEQAWAPKVGCSAVPTMTRAAQRT